MNSTSQHVDSKAYYFANNGRIKRSRLCQRFATAPGSRDGGAIRFCLVRVLGDGVDQDGFPIKLTPSELVAVVDVPIEGGGGYLMDGIVATGADGVWRGCVVTHQPVAPAGGPEVVSLLGVATEK